MKFNFESAKNNGNEKHSSDRRDFLKSIAVLGTMTAMPKLFAENIENNITHEDAIEILHKKTINENFETVIIIVNGRVFHVNEASLENGSGSMNISKEGQKKILESLSSGNPPKEMIMLHGHNKEGFEDVFRQAGMTWEIQDWDKVSNPPSWYDLIHIWKVGGTLEKTNYFGEVIDNYGVWTYKVNNFDKVDSPGSMNEIADIRIEWLNAQEKGLKNTMKLLPKLKGVYAKYGIAIDYKIKW